MSVWNSSFEKDEEKKPSKQHRQNCQTRAATPALLEATPSRPQQSAPTTRDDLEPTAGWQSPPPSFFRVLCVLQLCWARKPGCRTGHTVCGLSHGRHSGLCVCVSTPLTPRVRCRSTPAARNNPKWWRGWLLWLCSPAGRLTRLTLVGSCGGMAVCARAVRVSHAPAVSDMLLSWWCSWCKGLEVLALVLRCCLSPVQRFGLQRCSALHHIPFRPDRFALGGYCAVRPNVCVMQALAAIPAYSAVWRQQPA